MATVDISAEALDGLRTSCTGTLLTPAEAAYEEARRVHNGYIDRRPALIACCRGTADVVEALAFARDHGLEVAIRGGGHNVAGRAVVDDGLVIDLSSMKGVHVDPARRTARAQGGVTWKEFNQETQLFELATTGGVVSSTGIAGLTLGGGLGYLMAEYGMTVDNLLSAQVVLADGRVVTASEQEDPDLFWAIRGGGGNFGVVTSFEYRLHPVSMVTGGLAAWPLEQAGDVLRLYREITREFPDQIVAFCGLVHAPDGSGAKLAAIAMCDGREPGTDDAITDRVKSFGSPALDAIGPMPYAVVNTLMDAAYPKGAFNYWKSSFLEELSDDAIDLMIEKFAEAPSPMDAILLEHFHGEATRVPVEATAFPHRREGYNFGALAEWMDPALEEACVEWARDSYAAMAPYRSDARYVNYLGDDDAPEEVGSAYGPNLPRLRTLKAKYDPENVFHLNQNILPAEETAGV